MEFTKLIKFKTFSRECINEVLITEEYLKTWDEVNWVLSYLEYFGINEGKVCININWQDHIELIKMNILNETSPSSYNENIPKLIDVKCNITANYLEGKGGQDENKTISSRGLNHYLEIAFVHLFLVLNLSAPGVFNPRYREINVKDGTKYDVHEMSAYNFEVAWVDSIRNDEWPTLYKIPLENVWDWFKKLDINTRQIANTRLERALLLQIVLFGFLKL